MHDVVVPRDDERQQTQDDLIGLVQQRRSTRHCSEEEA
jgi:hypothetical protein